MRVGTRGVAPAEGMRGDVGGGGRGERRVGGLNERRGEGEVEGMWAVKGEEEAATAATKAREAERRR